jgi:hypothetical protein
VLENLLRQFAKKGDLIIQLSNFKESLKQELKTEL